VPRAEPWTVGALVRYGARRFRGAGLAFGHGTTNARDEAAWLVLHALGLPPDAVAGAAGRPLGPREARRALALIDRRIRSRKPAAYLVREAWLGDFRFCVDERVVVPRSHIAGVLRAHLAPWISDRNAIATALDLCTGSGCLAVLLAHSFPRARIDATDLSPAALAVARANVRSYRLGRRVRLLRSDLFRAVRGRHYDLIVCNPPYVTAAAMRRLPREYRHEPPRALAGGRDGLGAVRSILLHAAAHLNPGGLLVVEVGAGRRRLERAFPCLPFTWPETAVGDSVFLIAREELDRAPAPGDRAGPRLSRARARRGARALRAA